MDTSHSVATIDIQPGETRLVLEHGGAGRSTSGLSLWVYGRQEESSDDGGSQTPVGYLDLGPTANRLRVEFDVREGVALNLPDQAFSLSVWNRNESEEPVVNVCAIVTPGHTRGRNTRSFDIDTQNWSMRVPAYAESVSYELATPDDQYRALVSDSATGDDYGRIAPGTLYPIHHRCRWIRFVDVPPAGGIVTFYLSI